MDMQRHILEALREQFIRWEEVLARLSDDRITAPSVEHDWSVKDVVTHLWAWQQVSVARMEAAALGREPVFPPWVAPLPEDWEEDADRTNAAIHASFHQTPWPEVHRNWREGYHRLIELGALVPERNLLDGSRYPWLNGYSAAFVLVASYDHHQEHLEKLLDWLRGSGEEVDEEPLGARVACVKVDRIMPFSPPGEEDTYLSRMLFDASNTGSHALQLNHGVVKAGRRLPGGIHPAPYDEIYYVLSGEAVLNMDGVDYDLERDVAVFIPAGTFHALTNKSQAEDFVILTIWPGTPEPGANEVYDLRKAIWGTSYREV